MFALMIGLVLIVGVVVIVMGFGTPSMLNEDVREWTDEELVRRREKIRKYALAQGRANYHQKAVKGFDKVKEIETEMVRRQQAYEKKQLKADTLFPNSGLKVDIEKAIIKANEGNIEARVLVGTAFLTGADGFPQDPRKGTEHLMKAAEAEHGYAQFLVACLYAEGVGGLEQNREKAIEWARKADNKGVPDAKQLLAGLKA